MSESRTLRPRAYVRASYAIGSLVVLAVLVLVVAGRFGARAEGAYSIPVTRVSTVRPSPPAAEAAPPVALIVKAVDPKDALRINSEIPISGGPNPAATPFSMGKASAAARDRALDCLTAAIYYEAARESDDGQRAVAQVVLNRVRHPAFPSSVCSVVYQGSTLPTGCQFTFTCDGSLLRPPERSYWLHARVIAKAALDGAVFAPVGLATHYHANYVVPVWAPNLVKNAAIGAHKASRTLGARNPQLIDLQKQRADLAAKVQSPAAEIAAIDAEIKEASKTLGPNHPQMQALEQRRAELVRKGA